MPEKSQKQNKLATVHFTPYYAFTNYTLQNDTKTLKIMFPATKNS